MDSAGRGRSSIHISDNKEAAAVKDLLWRQVVLTTRDKERERSAIWSL